MGAGSEENCPASLLLERVPSLLEDEEGRGRAEKARRASPPSPVPFNLARLPLVGALVKLLVSDAPVTSDPRALR